MSIPTILMQRQGAEATIETSFMRAGARVAITPAGLLAIGGMVSAILLGSAAIVRAGTAAPRRRRD